MKSFLLEIRNKYKELRISERKVADAILEEKVNILDCTIEDFSKIVASVSRQLLDLLMLWD